MPKANNINKNCNRNDNSPFYWGVSFYNLSQKCHPERQLHCTMLRKQCGASERRISDTVSTRLFGRVHLPWRVVPGGALPQSYMVFLR